MAICYGVSMIFCALKLVGVFLVFANQPTVHSGGGSLAVAVGVSDRGQVIGDR